MKNSYESKDDWVVGANNPIKNGKGKFIQDYKTSRYICYLIIQNADSKKQAIVLSQNYIVVQTGLTIY